MPVKQYSTLTNDIFKQIVIVKDFIANLDGEYVPLASEDKIEFKFTKPGFNKLLLFDLDETLIHVQRDLCGDEPDPNEVDFEPDVKFPVINPFDGEEVIASFAIRPYVQQCLELANKHFEVGIFTAGKQWFADPILDYLDPSGQLFQHRFYR